MPDTWSMAQTDDGWLWFGGPNGLARFDGLRFEKVEIPSPGNKLSDGLSSLYAAPGGSLLIGHTSGGISVLSSGELKHYDTEQTRRSGTILGFAQNAKGEAWATAVNGLLRFDGQAWQAVGSDWNYPGGYSSGVLLDGRGTLWVATRQEVFRLPRGSHRFESVHKGFTTEFIQSPDGRIWSIDQHGAQPLTAADASTPRDPLINSRMSYVALFDRRGDFWKWWSFSVDDRSPEPAVRGFASLGMVKTILEDREGSIWLGSQNAEIHRLRRPAFVRVPGSPMTESGGTPGTSFASDKAGKVWMVMSSGSRGMDAADGVWRLDDGVRRVQPDELKSATVMTRDAAGDVWLGGNEGVWKLVQGRFTKVADLPDDARNAYVNGLTVQCAGGVWVSARGVGLLHHNGLAWQGSASVRGLPATTPTTQTCDSAGHLWLGYADGSLAQVDDGRASIFTGLDGPKVGSISAISAGRRILVAGERGLAVMTQGGFLTVKARIPALEGATGLIQSGNGDVWLNGVWGLAHVTSADIDLAVSSNVPEIAIELFDGNDGFPVPAFAAPVALGPTLVQTSVDRIWLAGHGGIAWIDPSTQRHDAGTPPLVIRSLKVGERQDEFARAGQLPKGTRNLEITYAALNYSHPERLRFRYRLDGTDPTWVDAGTRRQAFYTNLGPGTYNFTVNVTNENGNWTDSSVSHAFEIPPTFLQSKAFLVLCCSVVLGSLLLLYRLRVHQITAREGRRLADLLNERERIARELHDTLLQSTQGLILQFQAAANEMQRDDPVRGRLDNVLDRADAIMAEGRDRVADLRVPSDSLRDFPNALVTAGEELSREGTATFLAVIEGPSQELEWLVRYEAYRVAREALFNAFRHSQARAVELQIIYSAESFRVRVRDDGVGIDQIDLESGSRPGHWGLPGMRERAHQIGGLLQIWSRSGAGTEVELSVPASVAYGARAAAPRWLARWLPSRRA